MLFPSSGGSKSRANKPPKRDKRESTRLHQHGTGQSPIPPIASMRGGYLGGGMERVSRLFPKDFLSVCVCACVRVYARDAAWFDKRELVGNKEQDP
ncbi:hypothetical protein HYQ44_017818 [Verticillium longisporum]|nr:hypothetical protein HYQ44_017818 [Verticillium longisporum]